MVGPSTAPIVLTSRVTEMLDRVVATAAAGPVEPIQTLIRFHSGAELDGFLARQQEIGRAVGRTRQKPMTVTRVLRSVNTAAVVVHHELVGNIAAQAADLGILMLDTDFPVAALLVETAAREHVPVARAAGLRGDGVRIAVLDTGVDDTHPDLQGAVVLHRDHSGEGAGDHVGHGTHVASIIAGRGTLNPPRPGIADRAEIVDIKVLGADGSGSASTVIAGIEDAVDQGVQIINMSLGAAGDFDGTDALSDAANWAVDQGIVVCAAAGNCGPGGSPLACPRTGDRTIGSPGCAARVITVGAVDKALAVASYSSRGPTLGGVSKPDIVTVGSDVVAARAAGTSMGTPLDQYFTRASGTSMATPVCAGLVALKLEQARKAGRTLTPDEVKDAVLNAAALLPGWREADQGRGFLDCEHLLGAVAEVGVEVNFAPRTGSAIAAQTSEWTIEFHSKHDSRLYELEAQFQPTPGVTAQPEKATLASLDPGQRVRVSVALRVEQPGDHRIALKLRYRTQPGGAVTEADATVTANILPAGGGGGDTLNSVLNSAIARYMARQNANGTWTGSIMYNVWPAAMLCIAYRVLGLPEPTACLKWVEQSQTGLDTSNLPDHTWGFIDPPSLHMLETTIVSAIALEIWGRPRDPKTWNYLDQQSLNRLAPALALADPFTQTFAALASPYRPSGRAPYYDVRDVFAPPLETILSPPLLKLSIPRLIATWAQDPVIGLMIMLTIIKGEGGSPFKMMLLKYAEAQLLRHQNPNGSWYCTVLPTLAGVMALWCLGYPLDSPQVKRAMDFLKTLERPDGYVERFHLPVWDTGLSVIGLRAAGIPATDERLRKAGSYLVSAMDPVTGGVPFQTENAPWPDTDDTAIACLALADLDMGPLEPQKKCHITESLRWLFFMQGRDGGWASFQKNQSTYMPGRLPFFQNDPATPDVSGHVMSALKLAAPYGFTAAKDSIDRGVSWLQRTQLSHGEWFGRWGLTYTYGTSAVLQGLFDLHEPMDTPFVREAGEYLLSTQRADGGWGESFITYYNLDAPDIATSTVEQTAWSVLGLMTLPETQGIRDAIDRGIAFILKSYNFATGWPETPYTVGALWVYKNTVYPYVWAIWALGLYRQRRGG